MHFVVQDKRGRVIIMVGLCDDYWGYTTRDEDVAAAVYLSSSQYSKPRSLHLPTPAIFEYILSYFQSKYRDRVRVRR